MVIFNTEKRLMEESGKFREKIKNIEIGLSNILHDQLTNEFIVRI